MGSLRPREFAARLLAAAAEADERRRSALGRELAQLPAGEELAGFWERLWSTDEAERVAAAAEVEARLFDIYRERVRPERHWRRQAALLACRERATRRRWRR